MGQNWWEALGWKAGPQRAVEQPVEDMNHMEKIGRDGFVAEFHTSYV